MSTTIRVFAHPEGQSWNDIQESIGAANALQGGFKFALKALEAPLSGEPAVVDPRDYESDLTTRPEISGLIFCEEEFRLSPPSLVFEVLPKRVYVSCRLSRAPEAPPFRLFLLYQMAAAALTLAARLAPETNEGMLHRPPAGCLWDWWKDGRECHAAMLTARVCSRCEDTLKRHGGVQPESITETQSLLDYVRQRMMGKTPIIPDRIFIAHGSSDDWRDLDELLRQWGLKPDYFNREVVTGIVVTDRWRNMLDRARFAIALMTPDDILEKGGKRARQNVLHEIGLCHARLGLLRTAILVDEETEKFSNIGGLNTMSFKSGELKASHETLRRLLEERGILDPSEESPPD
jgi:predicted nucleotide-binding protein